MKVRILFHFGGYFIDQLKYQGVVLYRTPEKVLLQAIVIKIAKFNRKRITPGIILYNIKQGNFTIYPVENMDNYFNDYSLQQIVEVDSLSFQKSLIELFNRLENRKLVEDLSKAQFLEYRP